MIIGEHDRALRSVIGRSTRRTARKVVGDPALVQSRGSAVGDAHPAAGVLPRPIVGEAAGDGEVLDQRAGVGCAGVRQFQHGVRVVGGDASVIDVPAQDRKRGIAGVGPRCADDPAALKTHVFVRDLEGDLANGRVRLVRALGDV